MISGAGWRGAALGALLAGACGPRSAWMEDESHRIDAVMYRERFCRHLSGAKGISVEYAPPLAPPPARGETYRLSSERDRRLSGPRSPQPRRARWKERSSALDR